MKLAQHAAQRAKERGIPPILVDLLMSYGATEKAGEGAITYYFDKSSKRRFRTYAGPLANKLEEHLDCDLVASAEGRVITIGHRYKRIKHQ